MSVIIIEGPDGAGKTTLALRLRAWLADATGREAVYRHEGPPPTKREMLSYYARKLLWAAYGRRHVVFDRFHLGETIYGPLARGRDRLGPHGLRVMDRLIKATHALVIVCLPSARTCRQSWWRDPLDFFGHDGDKHRACWKTFKDRARGRAVVYNRDHETMDHLVNTLGQGWSPWILPLPRGLIGSRGARYLVLGERANARLDLPFAGTAGCSPWLQARLEEAGFEEDDLAFANAFKVNRQANDLSHFLGALPNLRRVITLGRTAQRAMVDAGLPGRCCPVPHPAYWKRFFYNSAQAYSTQLAQVRKEVEGDI